MVATANCAYSPEECEYSLPSWKRVPTTADVLFGLALPYQAPKSALGAFLWRRRLWFETTFALSMLQPWEKVVLLLLSTTLSILFTMGVYLYFPGHISVVLGRAKYYLLGQDSADVGVAESIHRFVASWTWNDTNLLGKAVEL